MEIHHDWRALPLHVRGATVALGNFDGVHRGHAHVLSRAHAARPETTLAVLTFEPHPRAFFRPDDPPFHLTNSAERAAALAQLGVRHVIEVRFDAAFSALSADEFVHRVLHDSVGAVHVACGADFAFGHRRGGDVGFLAQAVERLGIGLTVVPALADVQGPISSTRIRRALQDGYPERAADDLGRPWSISGEVVHGDARGRTIGFPTANIALGSHLEPARGVYAVTAMLGGARVAGVANIGRRPTVAEGAVSRLEAHFFDFAGDLYGQDVAVSLHAFLRSEQKFSGLDALKAQIATDSAQARAVLAA